MRHGETAWTITGQHTGYSEIPLTAHGRAQAAALAPVIERLLADRDPVVLASPRQRTVQTAELALPGREPALDDALREFDYGDYEGLTSAQINERVPGWTLWTHSCPHGETIAAASRRVDALLADLRTESRPIVLVTHGHTSRILTARALGLPAQMGSILDSATGSLSQLRTVHGELALSLWNYVPAEACIPAEADLSGAGS